MNAALRPDIRIVRDRDKLGKERFFLEDPRSGAVYLLRQEEHYLCEQIATATSTADIQERFEKKFNATLDLGQLEAFIRQLGERGLLTEYISATPSKLELFQFLSPENWKRWKFFNPELLLVWLAGKLSWCYSRLFVSLCLLVFFCAVGTAYFNFTDLLKDIRRLVLPLNIFQVLAVMYFFVNIPGEFVRGITSTRFGGRGNECGIWLAYEIMPRFYCLSRVWAIPGKAQRGWTLFSPSFFTLLVGSLGLLVWRIAPAGGMLRTFGLTLTFVSVLDSVMRLNVLWPNVAHYLLSNWLGMENFRKRAIRAARAWLFRRPLPEPLTAREKRWLVVYGLLTALTTFPSLAFFAYFGGKLLIHSYAGMGGLVIVGIVSIKYRKGISGLFKKEKNMAQNTSEKSTTWKKRLKLTVVLVVIVIVMILPYPFEVGGSFKLLPLERVELHSVVEGKIKQVLVKENSVVKQGDIQAMIDTHEHQKNLDVVKANLVKAKEDLKLLEKGPKPEEIEKAKKQVATAKTQAEYSRKEEVRLKGLYKEGVVAQEEYESAANKADVDERNLDVATANLALVKSGPLPEEIQAQKALVQDYETRVRYYSGNLEFTNLLAPIAGKVVTPYIEMKVGQYLKAGDLFAVYENAEEIQAEVHLPEADVAEIKVGSEVKVRPEAYPLRFFSGTVVLIAPNALETPDGKVVRVVTRIPNTKDELKPEMTGEAKIKGEMKPVIVAFTRALVRFFMVEVWSWFP